jgi:hypothetical protein
MHKTPSLSEDLSFQSNGHSNYAGSTKYRMLIYRQLFQIFLQGKFANNYFALVVKIRNDVLFAKINASEI